jgi:pantetheine-phosphate adenylyltransferase
MADMGLPAAFYSGSFDPPTLGHLDIICRALCLFPRLVIGVGTHHGKSPLFSPAERVEMLRDALSAESLASAEIVTFDGLVVEAARQHGTTAIVRGIRDAADLAYEMQMAGMNGTMAPGITTLFLPALPGHAHIAATFVRQIAGMGGDVSSFVPPAVAARLAAKFPPP